MLLGKLNSLVSLTGSSERLSKNLLNLSPEYAKQFNMKLKYLVVFLLMLFVGLNAANNKKLFGVWEIVEFNIIQKGKPALSDEKTLRDAGAEWNMYFNEDGSFKQEFNMRSPAKKMETETGKWSSEKDSLFIEIQVDTFTRKLNYSYILLGDAVVLTLQHPTNPDKIVTKFRRK